MASGNYTPTEIISTTSPLSFSNYNYNYTSALPSVGLSNFGTYATTNYTSPLDTIGVPARQQSSYNVNMDNELLRDLEKLRSGTLSKPSDTVAPAAGEFISTLSFGANSHYVRDSIRSGLSQ